MWRSGPPRTWRRRADPKTARPQRSILRRMFEHALTAGAVRKMKARIRPRSGSIPNISRPATRKPVSPRSRSDGPGRRLRQTVYRIRTWKGRPGRKPTLSERTRRARAAHRETQSPRPRPRSGRLTTRAWRGPAPQRRALASSAPRSAGPTKTRHQSAEGVRRPGRPSCHQGFDHRPVSRTPWRRQVQQGKAPALRYRAERRDPRPLCRPSRHAEPLAMTLESSPEAPISLPALQGRCGSSRDAMSLSVFPPYRPGVRCRRSVWRSSPA